MKLAALAVLAAAAVPFAIPARGAPGDPASQTPAKRRVLVTAFQPFDGRPENNSTRIAALLENHPALPPDVEVVLCSLPVEYDRGAVTALACLEAMGEKPELVLSLGESGCSMELETAALNEDDVPGFPDNAGVVRSNQPIVAGEPERKGFDLPVQAMYCALSPAQRKTVNISNSMNYVCNNTAYRLASALRGSGMEYGFVHVPTIQCGERSEPGQYAGMLAHMIEGALAHQVVRPAATYALPHCTNEAIMPTSLEELARAASSIAEADAAACEKEFLERLKERM